MIVALHTGMYTRSAQGGGGALVVVNAWRGSQVVHFQPAKIFGDGYPLGIPDRVDPTPAASLSIGLHSGADCHQPDPLMPIIIGTLGRRAEQGLVGARIQEGRGSCRPLATVAPGSSWAVSTFAARAAPAVGVSGRVWL